MAFSLGSFSYDLISYITVYYTYHIQLWPEILVISTRKNPFYGMYNPIEITCYNHL